MQSLNFKISSLNLNLLPILTDSASFFVRVALLTILKTVNNTESLLTCFV